MTRFGRMFFRAGADNNNESQQFNPHSRYMTDMISAAGLAEGGRMVAPLITIDGPGGVGKSALAARLARALGWRALDTGATYRALALHAMREDLDPGNESEVARAAKEIRLELSAESERTRVDLDGEDVTEAIRDEAVSRLTPRIASHPSAREALIQLQRRMASRGPTVAEGRDMGTVVFPAAPLKFYLTASTAERARRRMEQQRDPSPVAGPESVAAGLEERDRLDRNRQTGALRAAPDACVLDSSRFNENQMLAIMTALAENTPWNGME